MKLDNLLEEVKLGAQFYNESKSSDEIIKLVDPDLHLFLMSKRVAQLKEELTEDSETLNLIGKVERTFASLEEKVASGNFVSNMGKKIKLYELVENYNKLISKFENKKFHNTVNKDKFSRIFATMKFGISQISEQIGTEYSVNEIPLVLEEVFESELNLIEDIVS